jgi:hypothetical protein
MAFKQFTSRGTSGGVVAVTVNQASTVQVQINNVWTNVQNITAGLTLLEATGLPMRVDFPDGAICTVTQDGNPL